LPWFHLILQNLGLISQVFELGDFAKFKTAILFGRHAFPRFKSLFTHLVKIWYWFHILKFSFHQ
jgi:hypothetical protein